MQAQTMPERVVLALPGFRAIVSKAEEFSGVYFDEGELLSNIFQLIDEEDKAIEQLEWFCFDMVDSRAQYATYPEMDVLLHLFLELGSLICQSAKMYGLYRNGRLGYLLEKYKNNAIVIRQKDAILQEANDELNQQIKFA